MQMLGSFHNPTNNGISFLRLLTRNGAAAAAWAPAVWEEEFVPTGKCIALGQLVPLNPTAHHPGSRNNPALPQAGTGASSCFSKDERKKVSMCFPALSPSSVVLPNNKAT